MDWKFSMMPPLSHQAAAITKLKKIVMGMWVPNSESGHNMCSLEGENEIPQIPIFDFLAKTCFSPFLVELVRK